MAFLYDSYDLHLTDDGDLALTFDKDIKATYEDAGIAILQAIKVRIQSVSGSWRLYPSIGVESSPLEMMNTEEDAERWNNIIRVALTKDGLVEDGHLSVETFPVGYNTWMTVITLEVFPTIENNGVNQLRLFTIGNLDSQSRFYY